jgi:sugar phosphate permease
VNALARRLPFHYGWVVLAASIASNAISGGSIFWAVAIYVPATADEFGVGRSWVVAAFMVGQTVFALVGPIVGRTIDRRGARDIMRAGVVLMPLALLATSQSQEVWQFFLGWLVVSLIRPTVMPIPLNWTLTRWFEGRRRQTALGLVTVGFGLGGALMLPIYDAVASASGWRTVMILSAVLIAVIHGAVVFVIVRDRPAEMGLRPVVNADERRADDVPEAVEWGFTASEALRAPAFWLMSIGLMLFFMGQGSVTTLALDFFDTRGIAWGATALAASALLRTVARVPLGLAMGSISSVYLLAVAVAMSQGIAVGALLVNGATVGVLVWVVFWGIGGAFAPMLEPLMVTKAFGVRNYGAVAGITQMVAFGGQLFGTIGGAVLFDITGSYEIPYTAYAVGFVLAALLFWLFGRASVMHSHRSRAAQPDPR